MLEGGICVSCSQSFYRMLFGSRRRFNVVDFVENEGYLSEIIEILEEIDLEIEEADIMEIPIEKILLGRNIHDKLLKAEEFFIFGIGDGKLENKILEEYRGIPVEILEDEGDLDDIDFILGV